MKGLAMSSGSKESGVRIEVDAMVSSNSVLSKFPPITVKKEFGGRLASFKPPRDLTLSGTSSHLGNFAQGLIKKTFTPNVNVVRRKGAVPSAQALDSSAVSENKSSERVRKPPRGRGNYIQTSSVFSSGLAPGRPKEYSRGCETPSPQIEKPKLNLNRVTNKKKEDSRMKDLLKDDFIDDPGVLPDLNDCPKSLPLLINAKSHLFRNLDDTFESLQLKTEKFDNIKAEDLDAKTPDLCRFFSEPGSSRLIVLDFPDEIPIIDDKKSSKEVKQEPNNLSDSAPMQRTHRLANVGEGHWGTLRILANGAAYILVGKEKVPIMLTRHCPRQTVMSTSLDTANSKGELVNLGVVNATFKCFTDLSPHHKIE